VGWGVRGGRVENTPWDNPIINKKERSSQEWSGVLSCDSRTPCQFAYVAQEGHLLTNQTTKGYRMEVKKSKKRSQKGRGVGRK